MMRATPWQTGEICGPVSAKSLNKPEQLKRVWSKAKKPLMIVGSKASTIKFGKGDMIDFSIEFSKITKTPIVATGGAVKHFIERGFEGAKSMGVMEIVGYLQDPKWKGPHGQGPHDMILTHSLPYYMEWTMLSGIMNFARHIVPISLSRYYQPHATWSMPNLKEKNYQELLKGILVFVGGGK